MKKLSFLFIILIAYAIPASAQEVYTYYYASYQVEGGMREMMVCKTTPFKWVDDKVSGMSQVNYVPEANFRNWLERTYGGKTAGRDFYPCTSAEQAINYYKDFAATYQQGHSPFKNSAYCSSIYSITYVAPTNNTTSNTSSGNNSNGSTSNSTTSTTSNNYTQTTTNSTPTETASQRQYREQQERVAQIQQQSEVQSKQFVQNATELVGMVGNVLADAKAAREKKLEKKEAEQEAEKQRIELEKLKNLGIIKDNMPQAEAGDITAINTVASSYFWISDFEAARSWYMKSANKNSIEGMIGMAKVSAASIGTKWKVIKSGNLEQELEDSLQVSVRWYIKAANLGSDEAYKTLFNYFRNKLSDETGDIGNTRPWSTLKGNKEIFNSLISGANKMHAAPLKYLNIYYYKETRGAFEKALKVYKSGDFSVALPLITDAASKFSAEGLAVLSIMYCQGQAVKVNEKEAFSLAMKSALIGYKQGMALVALYYKNGVGVDKNEVMSAEWKQNAEKAQ
jgi:TPR repeat protein